VRVYAESIGSGSRFRGDDNVAITIRFADGSIGTVTYTAAGDSTLGKEYLEVYGEGGVAILDDFRTLLLAKNRKQEKVKAANQDKGFEEEMRRFVAAAKSGGEMPIPSTSSPRRRARRSRRWSRFSAAVRSRSDEDPGRLAVLRARDGRAGGALHDFGRLLIDRGHQSRS